MIVLGIESSCDETAASVVKDGKILLSNVVFSSMDLHKAYGGVVPEIAARSHVESIIPVIEQALQEAFGSNKSTQGLSNTPRYTSSKAVCSSDLWSRIDAIAVTYGAGLGGSLLVGVMTARSLSIAKNKPLYAINHVEAHVYANFLTSTVSSTPLGKNTWSLGEQTYVLPEKQPQFPLLALIVSGGHTQLALFTDHFEYKLLGQTRDDAIGEAFDKVAKVIGLPYPGGPNIAKAAELGDPHKYKLPKARLGKSYEFSFSGLKTAVLRLAQDEIGEDFTFPSYQVAARLSERQKNDIAASFQHVAIQTVVDKTVLAYDEFQPKSVVIAGGVAASRELRRQLSERFAVYEPPASPLISIIESQPSQSAILSYTDQKLCTDNGAMIATLGCYKAMLKQPTADPYSLQIQPNLSM